MRTFQLVTTAALAIAVVAAASPAFAEEAAGTYDVKYEEVADNCTTGLSMSKGELNIRNEGKQVVVDIARLPKMYGKPSKTGVVRATSPKGRTSIEGLDGKFSIAGRADGTLELVLVAEYYVKDSALCTQSWNVSGTKKTEAKASAAVTSVVSMPLVAPAR